VTQLGDSKGIQIVKRPAPIRQNSYSGTYPKLE